MTSFVDITDKRRRHQLSLHPSADVSPLYARYILGMAGQIISADQSLPRPHTLASNLVRWVEARAKLDALYAVFLGHGPVFHSLPLMSPVFSILIEMEHLQQITTRNTAVSSSFPLMSRPGLGTWISSIHGPLLFSLPRAQ